MQEIDACLPEMDKMKRFEEQKLDIWLNSLYRKPLVIRGARQVGKSTLVRQFARDNGLTLHEVNLERHPALADVFKTHDIKKILGEIQFICGKGPVNAEKSLLFLDEIQATPVAIQTLRYFYEDCPELHVIAAGSLMEFALSKKTFTMPVGRIEYLFLGPMTFEETLLALGKERLLKLLRDYRADDAFPESAHERFLDIQRVYLLVGGMPEAVQRYVDTRDFDGVIDVHASIVETYRDDFAKYARQADLLRLHKVFDYVPMGIGEKFKYVRVDSRDQARELRRVVDLLAKAQVIMRAFHTDASGPPLRATIDDRIFKPFFLDCGLVNFICGVRKISPDVLKRREFINEGKIAEQFIAQHLSCLGRRNTRPILTYWLREGRSKNAEVDFIVQFDQSIVPIEVKAGKSGSLKSLQQFILQKKTERAIRFDLNPPSRMNVRHSLKQPDGTVSVSFNLLSLPLYMIEEAPRLFREGGRAKGEGTLIVD